MAYKLQFMPRALKAWEKLDGDTRTQFSKKLKERLENPHVPAAQLHGLEHCYKVKLRTKGYRLVYQVKDAEVIVLVLAVAPRSSVYDYVKMAP